MRKLLTILLLCSFVTAQSTFIGPNKMAGSAILPSSTGGSSASYTFVQRVAAVGNAVTLTVGAGHAVIVMAAGYGSTAPTCTVSDGSTNLTKTPASPSFSANSPNRSWCNSYILSETSGSKTFTVTWGGSGINAWAVYAEEYSYTGSPAFDTEVYNATLSGAQPITVPSITPANSGELLISIAFPNGTITAASSPWTAAGTSTAGLIDAYITPATSGATSVNFTDGTTPDEWYSFALAFK